MTPIVDSHAYCFSAPDTPAGHPTVADHMALWQWGYARHHQPAFRVRDRTPADSSVLARDRRPTEPSDWRPTVTSESTTTASGSSGPSTARTSPRSSCRRTRSNTRPAISSPTWTTPASTGRCSMSTRPSRRTSSTRPPASGHTRTDSARWRRSTSGGSRASPTRSSRQAREAIEVHGLHAIKIIPEYAYLLAGAESFDGPAWRPFWDAVTQLDVPIFFTLGAPPGVDRPSPGFLDELWTLARWADRYPTREASVTHGFNWRHHVSGRPHRAVGRDVGAVPRPSEPHHRGQLRRSGSATCSTIRGRVTRPVLEAMVENIGADRLLWGTDMPFQNRFCTYRQSRDAIERYSPFLDPGQIERAHGWHGGPDPRASPAPDRPTRGQTHGDDPDPSSHLRRDGAA